MKKVTPKAASTLGGLGALAAFTTAAPATKVTTNKNTVTFADGTEEAQMIDQYNEAKEQTKVWEAKLKEAESVLKTAGRDAAAETLEKGKGFESYVMSNKNTGILFILQNRFKKFKPEEVEDLKKVVGADHVTVDTTMSINNEILVKHPQIAQAIADALHNLDGIPAEDLQALLVPSCNVEFDFELDELGKIAKEQKTTVRTLIDLLNPVAQLKVRGSK